MNGYSSDVLFIKVQNISGLPIITFKVYWGEKVRLDEVG
jgi:hypothetical protein